MTCNLTLAKHEYFRSPGLMKWAHNQPCTLRLPGICRDETETTAGCHLNYGWAGKGMRKKADDVVVIGCIHCHKAMDGQNENVWATIYGDKEFYWLRALFETTRLILLAVQKGELKL